MSDGSFGHAHVALERMERVRREWERRAFRPIGAVGARRLRAEEDERLGISPEWRAHVERRKREKKNGAA